MANAKTNKTPPAPEEKATRGRAHVYDLVARYMYRGLMVGAFLPGQVMSLRKLAAALGTSPMPVREVLSRLVAANALEETKGGSVRVPRLTPEKIADLFDVREQLEGNATERAAKSCTKDLITELTAINKSLLQAIEKRDIMNCLSQNQKFHFTLYEASGSDVLMPLIESLWLQFGPTMYMSFLVPSMPWDASSHVKIIEALKAENPGAAKRAVLHDIRRTGQALLNVGGGQSIELPFTRGLELLFDT
ncbi:MAG: GntR family transcriptional regulator [Rhizobiales bacterium]|uniref:GntR family transcriptional regulator n=1 Tax=Xanthobacter autotrophicus TaxID=280 RepID=UPI001AC5D28B|nr:GntR family transcriptional regulator [Xanthobacter autotrophicus]MBN8915104.1 GntR family transcriptional regulator [Hyphomicrobiales bacterium]UDQ87853.1 GntR family transcriptional regulator [Xanthobacter autotrophicus]